MSVHSIRREFRARRWMRVSIVVVVALSTVSSYAQEPAAPVSFVKEIAPLLQSHCIACHNAGRTDGELAVDTVAALMKGGASGEMVVAGKSGESSLVPLLEEADAELRMPKNADPLSAEQIALVKRWIDEGANSDADEAFVIKPLRKELPAVAAAKQVALVSVAAVQPPLDAAIVYGPSAPSVAIAFSPDGKRLAVGGYQHVQLWDLEAGSLTHVFRGHADNVHSLAFSPDGVALFAAGGLAQEPGEVKQWNVATGECTRDFSGHKDTVYAVAASRDGKWLATGGADGSVIVWDAATGQVVHEIKEHGGWIYGLAFSADNQFLATACGDKTTRVFQAGDKWERVGNFDHTESVWNVAFNADASQLAAAVGGPSDKSVRIHTRSDGKVARTLGGHGEPVFDTAWSDDGKWLVTASADRSARLFDAASGSLKFTLAGHGGTVYSAAISADARLAATGDATGVVRLWNVADGKLVATMLSLNSDSTDWFLLTSSGYYASSSATPLVEWRRGDKSIPGDQIQSALAKPEFVQRALRGETVEAPTLPE